MACGHWISAPIVQNPTSHHTISFWPRSQHGGKTYIPKEKTRKTRSNAPKTLMHSFKVRLENEVKALLQANFDDNPLKYWDKDKAYADIQLKDANTIVPVKPIRYNQQDELEFKIQLKELVDRHLAFKSSEENKSPHSSLAFMVNNHSEQKHGKPCVVINYKCLNEVTIFDGYFLPNKEILINKTLSKKWFSKFDCKSGFYQIKGVCEAFNGL